MSELFLSVQERRGSQAWWVWFLGECAFALLLTVVALLPWVFSITQLDAIELPKQTFLLASGGLVWLVLTARDVLRGTWEFPWDRTSKIVVAILVVLAILASLSRDPYGSWVGINKQITTAVLTMLAGGVWWFAIRRIVTTSVRLCLTVGAWMASAGLFALGTTAWLFNKTVWPWSLSTFRAITPLGTVSETALFLIPVLLLAGLVLVQGTGVFGHLHHRASTIIRVLALAVVLPSLLLVGAVSSPVLWAALLAGMSVYAVSATKNRERWIWVGGVVASFVFLLISLTSPNWDPWRKLGDQISLTIPAEVSLSAPVSWSMAWQGFKTNPVLGRGAGTWIGLFLEHRDPQLNQSPFATVRFFQGSSSAATAAGTMGILGMLTLFVWLLLPLSIRAHIKSSAETSPMVGFRPALLAPWVALMVLWMGLSVPTSSIFLMWLLSALLVTTEVSVATHVTSKLVGRKRQLAPVVLIALSAMLLLWGSAQRVLAEHMFVAGKAALEQGRLDVAERTLALAHAWNPVNDVYAGLLAQAYSQEVRMAFANKPDQKDLARIVLILKRAEALNARARVLNPERSESWLAAATLAATHASLEPRGRDTEEDIVALKRAQRLDPTNTQITLALASVYLQRVEDVYPLLEQKDEKIQVEAKQRFDEVAKEAKFWFEETRRLDARVQQASIGLAQLALRQGDTQAAIAGVEQAIRAGNVSQDLQVQLALLYEEAHQVDLAMRLLEAVVKDHPSDAAPLARYHLAELYDVSGRYEEALSLLMGLAKQFPQEASLQQRVTEVQRELLDRASKVVPPPLVTTSTVPRPTPVKKLRR